MDMAIRTRKWTRRDLERMPDDNNRYEVVRGELFVTPAPSTRHQSLVNRLFDLLRSYVEREGLGEVNVGNNAVVFEGSQMIPDLIVRQHPQHLPDRWDDMPTPILVVEVLSESTRRRDLGAKREVYAEAGIDEYWIVDRDRRSIRRLAVGVDETATDRLEWAPVGASEPLTIDVAEYFRRALA